MITRKHLRVDKAIIYSWKIILFSFLCALAAYVVHIWLLMDELTIPATVIGVLGTALAIILGFRNASAYDRWWEARKLWGGIVNESRSLTRQLVTITSPENVNEHLQKISHQAVRRQIAWINALKLQLREIKDPEMWLDQVGENLPKSEYEHILTKRNKATHIMILQGEDIKRINHAKRMDIYSYIQMDDTLTRLTDLQGGCERIKATPLPRPYDYYTMAFLYTFVLFLPFSFIEQLKENSLTLLLFPISITTSWIFYQIYVLGMVLARPFDNLLTDVPLDAICRTIEIDLREIMHESEIPEPLQPVNGAIM